MDVREAGLLRELAVYERSERSGDSHGESSGTSVGASLSVAAVLYTKEQSKRTDSTGESSGTSVDASFSVAAVLHTKEQSERTDSTGESSGTSVGASLSVAAVLHTKEQSERTDSTGESSGTSVGASLSVARVLHKEQSERTDSNSESSGTSVGVVGAVDVFGGYCPVARALKDVGEGEDASAATGLCCECSSGGCENCEAGFLTLRLKECVYKLASWSKKRRRRMRGPLSEGLKELQLKIQGLPSEREFAAVLAEVELALF